MFTNNDHYKLNIFDYFRAVYETIFLPAKTFEKLELNSYQLLSFLVLSAWLYAIIANILKTLSPFVLLITSPISVIPHVYFIALSLYLIFGKLFKANTTFKECFKISSYILIALLPFMAIEFLKYRDTAILLFIKSLPFLYFIYLTYKATMIRFNTIGKQNIIRGNMLACLLIFFISTLVFSINMGILVFICEHVAGFNYIWFTNYD